MQLLLTKAYKLKNCLKEDIDLGLLRYEGKTESYAYVRVCSEHFVSGKPSKLYDSTNPDWSPSLNLGHSCIKQSDTSRHDRASSRAEKRRNVEQVELAKRGLTWKKRKQLK